MSAPSQAPSSAWATRLIAELDHADLRAKHLAARLSPLQLNWNPEPDRWSVGQCIDHLRAANDVYLSAIAASLTAQQPCPVGEIEPGWFSRWFIRSYIEPSAATKRARTPAKIAPETQADPRVLDLFLASNQSARELVRRAGHYDVNRIRFKNPFVPLLRFTVGAGFEIICAHQRRHLLQAERVTQTAGFPSR